MSVSEWVERLHLRKHIKINPERLIKTINPIAMHTHLILPFSRSFVSRLDDILTFIFPLVECSIRTSQCISIVFAICMALVNSERQFFSPVFSLHKVWSPWMAWHNSWGSSWISFLFSKIAIDSNCWIELKTTLRQKINLKDSILPQDKLSSVFNVACFFTHFQLMSEKYRAKVFTYVYFSLNGIRSIFGSILVPQKPTIHQIEGNFNPISGSTSDLM